MRKPTGTVALSRARQALGPSNAAVSTLGHGRTATYRRLHSITASRASLYESSPSLSRSGASTSSSFLLSSSSPPPLIINSVFARSFSSAQSWQKKAQPKQQDTAASEQPKPSEKPEADAKPADADKDAKPETERKEESSSDKDGEKKEGEEKDGEGKDGEKKEDTPPPPHGDKTPWQVFMETLNTEFKASKEWNEGTKALGDGYGELIQNPHLKRAKGGVDAATTQAGAALKKTGEVIGKGATAAWESPVGRVTRKGASAIGSGLDKATKPVRETEAYKSISDVIDDGSSSRYGGWVEKEERKRRRALREAEVVKKGGSLKVLEEDPEAGTNVTLHKDAAWKESWREFRTSSKLFQSLDGMKSVYEQSNNPLVETARSWADTIGGFFAENETAMVIKKLREMDPNFQLEPFLIEMREYILPEVLDAYVKGDTEILKQWLSAAQYNVYAALMQQYTTAGLKSDGRILDIRGVEVANARLLDPGDVPVFVITCRTQEVHVYRNKKSGELAAGVDDKVQQVTYAIGVTRIPEDVNNPETRGWRLIELQKSARDYY